MQKCYFWIHPENRSRIITPSLRIFKAFCEPALKDTLSVCHQAFFIPECAFLLQVKQSEWPTCLKLKKRGSLLSESQSKSEVQDPSDIERLAAIHAAAEPDLNKKPGLFQILLPVTVTALIFWWIFSGIDFDSLQKAMAGLPWLELTLVIFVFCAFFFVMDVFSFGAGLKQVVEPRAPWKDIFLLRGGTIFSGVIFAPLGEVFAPYYFYRRWQRSVLRTVGTAVYVGLIDSSCLAIALASAFLFFDASSISPYWLLLLAGHGSFLLLMSFFFSRFGLRFIPETLRSREFLFALVTATTALTLRIFLVRFAVFISVCLTLYYLLILCDIHLSAAQALVFMPLFMGSVFLPISAGGYGGPQGAAVLFLVQGWALCTAEQALAFSLLWSTFFLIGRAVVSGACVLPLWRMLQGIPKHEGSSV
jgi:uncharacterized membrane protein YbhN (UPF0104 family)